MNSRNHAFEHRAEGFWVQIAPLRAACPPTTRFVMVTATLAASVFAQLMEDFPGILPAFGPGEHPNLSNQSPLLLSPGCPQAEHHIE